MVSADVFWVYVIAWPLADLFNKEPIIGGVLVVGLYTVGVVGSRFVPNYFFIWSSCEYVLFLWLGFMIRKLPQIVVRIKWYIWLTNFVILFGMQEMVDSGVIHSLLEIAVHVTGSIAAFESLSRLAEHIDWHIAWFINLSCKTMPMYLFHQQIIYFTIYWLNGKVNPYFLAVINFVMALAGSFIISSVLMHWKATRFLIGEKKKGEL